MPISELFHRADWPYLRRILELSWPDHISALAAATRTARAVGEELSQEAMSQALGPAAAQALGVPWVVVQDAFANQRIFTVGGRNAYVVDNHAQFQVKTCRPSRLRDRAGWAEIACKDMQSGRDWGHRIAFCSGLLFVTNDLNNKERAGGHHPYHPEEHLATISRYNFIRNEWQQIALLPQELCPPQGWSHPEAGALASHEHQLYFSGGSVVSGGLEDGLDVGGGDVFGDEFDGFYFNPIVHTEVHVELDTVFVYDLDGDSWSLLPHRMAPRSGHDMISFEGTLWVVGGRKETSYCQKMDGEGRWHDVSIDGLRRDINAPSSSGDLPKFAILGGRLLIYFDTKRLLFAFDQADDKWLKVGLPSGLPHSGRRGGVAAVDDSRLVILGESNVTEVDMEEGAGRLRDLMHQDIGDLTPTGYRRTVVGIEVVPHWVEVLATPRVRGFL